MLKHKIQRNQKIINVGLTLAVCMIMLQVPEKRIFCCFGCVNVVVSICINCIFYILHYIECMRCGLL